MNDTHIFTCKTSTGIASVIGNVSFLVRDFFRKNFPKDFFKSVYIDTKMSQIDLEKIDVIKKNIPILIIRPRFSLEDESQFQRLPDWVNTNYFIFKNLKGNYLPIFIDEEKEIYVYSSPERIKLSFDIEIITGSRIQQLNTAYFQKGSFLHKGFFYINDCILETEIPKFMIKLIGENQHVNFSNPSERSQFQDYLSSHSQSLVVEKIKTSSGNPTWFYSFNMNLLSLFDGYPSMDDGRDVNMTKEFFKVTSSFVVEFWTPWNYFLEIKTTKWNLSELRELFTWTQEDMSDTDIVMNYTIPEFTPPKMKDLKHFFFSKPYICDIDVYSGTPDVLDFSVILTKEIYDVIQYNNKFGVDNLLYFDIDLYKENLVVGREFYEIDWEKLVIRNNNPEKTTYGVVFYVDTQLFNKTKYRLEEKKLYNR